MGLDEKDISLKALDAIKKCKKIYAEFYTNKGSKDELEKIIAKDILILGREKVESDFLIRESRKINVALLVSGDVLSATTHIELFLEAKKEGIEIELIHGPSIFTAVAKTGLQLYKFGRVTTLMKEDGYTPDSPYDVIRKNISVGLHSLVLLNTDMDVPTGLGILKELESKKKENIITGKMKIVACSELGREDSKMKYESLNNALSDNDFKHKIPACIIIPGDLNFKEEEMLELWSA
jgi:diphthine synthase